MLRSYATGAAPTNCRSPCYGPDRATVFCAMDDDGNLYDELERRALFDLPEEEPGDEPAPDLIEALREDDAAAPATAEPARDLTLGGYIEKHSRVPAFEGVDGQPYTVDVDVERDDEDPDAPYVAFYLFIRWAETGAGIMNHVESGDIARGTSEDDARRAAMELSLYEVRAELDAAITRRRQALED